jgi:hypothetical protein
MPSDKSSARKTGRPKVGATPVNVRFPPDELAALDGGLTPGETRPQAVRRLTKLALETDSGRA